jgi:RimJ/RimL family protein N-acetyltransferase
MNRAAVVGLACAPDAFRPVAHEKVRWLDQDEDRSLFRVDGGEPPPREDWEEWHAQGYRYCALVQDGTMLSKAAVWMYSDTAWELAAVWTDPAHRGQGYARSVCSFVTAHILASGRGATCHTVASNAAMLRVAESLGYRRCC